MTAIITRSALVYHGHNPAPEVASVVIDYVGGPRRVVTWSDVMRQRREEQSRRLANKRHCDVARVFKLWVAFFDTQFYAGWHAFLERFHDRTWIRSSWLQEDVMRLFPLVLPGVGDWEQWMIEFSKRYRRGTQDRKPRGLAFVWWNGRDEIRRAA